MLAMSIVNSQTVGQCGGLKWKENAITTLPEPSQKKKLQIDERAQKRADNLNLLREI